MCLNMSPSSGQILSDNQIEFGLNSGKREVFCGMISLQPVTQNNYEQCLNLKRERTTFVGNAYAVFL